MSEKQKILIVDDKTENLIALEKVLKEIEVDVVKATCGNEALKATLNHDLALAILDIQMPEMDGYELAEYLRSEGKTKNLPMIFLSAVYSDEYHVFKGYEAGAVDFITKPYNPYYLISKVKIFLQLDRQKKELLDKIELEKSKNYLESILMSVNDSIIVLSLNGIMKTVNKAALSLWGYKHKEMIDGNIGILFENDIYTAWLNSLKDYELSKNKSNIAFNKVEINIVTKKDIKIPALISGSALLNRNGDIQGAVLVAVDISDRKNAELQIRKMNEELEERVKERTLQLEISNKDLESFSYSVSHDLRTPLRAIDGFTNSLHKKYVDKLDDEGKRLINVIVDSTHKMDRLIDDLLSFSRLGKKDVKRSIVNMNQLFTDVFNELRALCPERNIDFKIFQLPQIPADASLMTHVVTNLLSNAVKFTQQKEQATIEVGSLKKNRQVIYYVKDNGAGFDMRYSNKLFTVFQRLHSDKEFEGTGVGLAIVLKIIQKHGGSIWAEAKVNRGATFYFSLPE